MVKHYILQARTLDGNPAYIENVPNGKNCGCICAECKGALIAKNKGTVKIHHFAHASGNDSIKCSQTALHLLAKEIIAEEKRIPTFQNGKIEFVHVDSVEQEKNLGDIIPDVYALYNTKPIAVEIFVSHAVDDEKFVKIQNHKLTTFEINLSQMNFETKEEVKQAIYDLKNIRLIYNEEFAKKVIEEKRILIKSKGIIKNITNDIVHHCPMACGLIGNRIVKRFSVRYSLCKICPFCLHNKTENHIYCLGHIDGQIPLWFLQADENKLLSIGEIQEKISNFKSHIRQYMIY